MKNIAVVVARSNISRTVAREVRKRCFCNNENKENQVKSLREISLVSVCNVNECLIFSLSRIWPLPLDSDVVTWLGRLIRSRT